MALLRGFGAWQNSVAAPSSGAAPATVTSAPITSGTWTRRACGGPGEPPCTYVPLPMNQGPPPQPTQATWSLKPGQKPPPPGEGWQGQQVPYSVPTPPDPTLPQPSPAIAVNGVPVDPSDPYGVMAGPPSSAPAPPPSSGKIFGLPPLVVVGVGGLLVFLIARRF